MNKVHEALQPFLVKSVPVFASVLQRYYFFMVLQIEHEKSCFSILIYKAFFIAPPYLIIKKYIPL